MMEVPNLRRTNSDGDRRWYKTLGNGLEPVLASSGEGE